MAAQANTPAEVWTVATLNVHGYGISDATPRFSHDWQARGHAQARRAEKSFMDFVVVRLSPTWAAA